MGGRADGEATVALGGTLGIGPADKRIDHNEPGIDTDSGFVLAGAEAEVGLSDPGPCAAGSASRLGSGGW